MDKKYTVKTIKSLSKKSGMSTAYINNKLTELQEHKLGMKVKNSWHFKKEAVDYLTGMTNEQRTIYSMTIRDVAQATRLDENTIYKHLPKLYAKNLAILPRPRLLLFNPATVPFMEDLTQNIDKNAPRKRRKIKISATMLDKLKSKGIISEKMRIAIELYNAQKHTIAEMAKIVGISRQAFYKNLEKIETLIKKNNNENSLH